MGRIPLVMTSGNRSHEPIAYQDDDVLVRLGGIAALFLRHNRPIHVRCDDSVVRVIDGQPLSDKIMVGPIRRSRGFAPMPIALPEECPLPILAVGGLFKGAVASIVAVRDRVSYEGQAAMQCKWLAADQPRDGAYPFAIQDVGKIASLPAACPQLRNNGNKRTVRRVGNLPHVPGTMAPLVIDTRGLIAAVAADAQSGVAAARIARRFHTTMAAIVVETCRRIRQSSDLNSVALSGGVFMNALLSQEATSGLKECGFEVHRHRLVPPNDAGLALGQLAVAAAQVAVLQSSTIKRGNVEQGLKNRGRGKFSIKPMPQFTARRYLHHVE